MDTPPDAIPSDLVARARAVGPGAVELVVDALQRGREEGEARARALAIEACEAERRALAEQFVDLRDEALDAFEAPFRELRPSPIVAAYYEGATVAIDACVDHVRRAALGVPTH